MNWLRHILIDLAVTVVIAIFAFTRAEWAYWVIVIYTPLILVLKLVAMAAGGLVAPLKKKQADAPPDWIFHVLYGANVVLLLVARTWPLAAGWVLIWGLSVAAERRTPVLKKR